MMGKDFDYEVMHRCQYEVAGGDCGEPATHKVWWGHIGTMLVCQYHFDFIKNTEKADAREVNHD